MRPRFRLPASWPPAHDPGRADDLRARYAATGAAAARLVRQPAFAAMLGALGGNSPYLADLALREARALRGLALCGPDAVAARARAALAAIPLAAPRARVAAALRQAKRQVALAAAVADIGGLWKLDQVTGQLTALAEAALRLATGHLLRAAHEAREIVLADPSRPESGSGFVVLGMGKLGAAELNYSSDIDLILLYDPVLHSYHRDGPGGTFTRMARNLVALMETRDADGYVFRTDLRLRPDPAATPPAIALPAALTYYESLGQSWERAAMIKARPVAGDLALGARFLAEIRPFVWRRMLDFAAIADVHAMKRRIDEHKRTALAAAADPVARVRGYDVKLGQGGIREIEFLAQTLQLVWGGRDPALRAPATLDALRELVRAGHIGARAGGELGVAYRFLRRVEHRVQMIEDRQTHLVPARPDDMARLAAFLGYSGAEAFAQALLAHVGRVRHRYAETFEPVPDKPEIASELEWSGVGEAPGTLAALAALGYREPAHIVATVRGWLSGRVRALQSARARELLTEVLPSLLAALARQPRPDAAFTRFETFVARQPAGVQLFSLFARNPALIERVATVLGAAPTLADHLAQVPAALEGLLAGEEIEPDPLGTLSRQLSDARTLEDALAIVRRTVRGEEFRLALATLEGRLDVDLTGRARTALADAALACLLPLVLADYATRNGTVPGGGMAVVALGKAGGREMLAGSDLDLMLIYDHPPEVAESTGARVMPVSHYYARAAHAIIAAVTAPGSGGPLYAVDMRLRPSGNKGPVAVSLGSFRRYHEESAWTWERMALTRARVVAGPPALVGRVEAAIRDALRRAARFPRLREDACAMRARLARDLPPAGSWDVKLRPGGLMEVEFVAQVLQLAHADDPEVLSPNTCEALQRLAGRGRLDAPDAALLVAADRAFRATQGLLRITVGPPPRGPLPEPVLAALARALGDGIEAADVPAHLDWLATQVRATFTRLIGNPEEC